MVTGGTSQPTPPIFRISRYNVFCLEITMRRRVMKNMFYEKRSEESCTYIFSPLSKRIPKKDLVLNSPSQLQPLPKF